MGLLSKKERESTHSCKCLSCFWSSIASISFPKSTIKYKKHIKKKKNTLWPLLWLYVLNKCQLFMKELFLNRILNIIPEQFIYQRIVPFNQCNLDDLLFKLCVSVESIKMTYANWLLSVSLFHYLLLI